LGEAALGGVGGGLGSVLEMSGKRLLAAAPRALI